MENFFQCFVRRFLRISLDCIQISFIFGAPKPIKLKDMKKESTIEKIKNEIEEVNERKMRYSIWVEQEFELIRRLVSKDNLKASSVDSSTVWGAVSTLKAHTDKLIQYKGVIKSCTETLDSLEWILDMMEEGGQDE